jgi:hypothetical protein
MFNLGSRSTCQLRALVSSMIVRFVSSFMLSASLDPDLVASE